MKRDPKFPAGLNATSATSACGSGAAGFLDNFDDVMWDELGDFSPQTPFGSRVTPIDVISGVTHSPIKSSSFQVNTLNSLAGGANGEYREASTLLAGSNFGFGLDAAEMHAVWAVTQYGAGGAVNYDQKTWPSTSVSPTWSETSQPDAADVRRQKNREWMRRSRQKKRGALNSMKTTVAKLEKQYAELSLQSSSRHSEGSTSAGALVPQSKMASDYTQAVELSKRIGAENLYLKAEIQHQAALRLNLTRVMQSCLEVDGPQWASQFQQPALGGEQVLRMQLDKMDAFEAAEEFGFHALTDLDLTRVILENSRTISRVQSQLLVPSSSDFDFGARTSRMQIFGWEMVQRVQGNIMECVFTKTFYGLNVVELMQKTWANDMRLGEYKKVKGETCRLEVLQQVNPNAYVVGRDVVSPTQDISTFRSVYVRFLIETSKRIPVSRATGIDASAPSTPPAYTDSDGDEVMLEAQGFVLGSQSVDTDYSRSPRAEDVRNKVAWAHISLSIAFLNVVNPVTGEVYQQLRWSGRTDYCGPEHAQRNASDMMQGLLRWELLVISPAMNLVSLSIE